MLIKNRKCLSSVHGTCVSGKRIEPGVKMELVQGDTLKLGESSRLYRLDWVPISFAYEINESFVPQLDSLDAVGEDTEGTIDQDENSLSSENEWGQCLSDKMEGLGLSMQETAKEAPMPEDLYRTFPEKDEVENNCLPEMWNKENEISSSHLRTLDASFTVEETKGVTDQDGDSSLQRNDEEKPRSCSSRSCLSGLLEEKSSFKDIVCSSWSDDFLQSIGRERNRATENAPLSSLNQ